MTPDQLEPRPDLIIAVPARDEADRLQRCLDAIRIAVDAARAADLVGLVVVAVAAHCCRDATVEIACAALASTTSASSGCHHRSGLVWVYEEPAAVGHVRTQLVLEAGHTAGLAPGSTWLFSTDADTRVPPSWIIDGLRLAAVSGADMITGLVDLDPDELDLGVIQLHDDLIRAGTRPDGTHDHAYAANLMIKMQTFVDVGGFPAVEHGEEHALRAAVRSSGRVCRSESSWRVTTSGRTAGRADHGLASVLSDLRDRVDAAARRHQPAMGALLR